MRGDQRAGIDIWRGRESHPREQTHRMKHLRLYKQSESFVIFENFFQMGLNF